MRAAGATTVRAPKAMGLRKHLRRTRPGRSVSFAELVWVHFLRQKELGDHHHDPYEGPAEKRYREFEENFEARHGAIVAAYWCRTEASGARQPAYTGSMLNRCRRIPRSAAKPGDLVVWTPPSRGQHVCVVVAAGPDPTVVSHGSDSGPKRLRFSAEDAYQRRAGHGNAVWLSAF